MVQSAKEKNYAGDQDLKAKNLNILPASIGRLTFNYRQSTEHLALFAFVSPPMYLLSGFLLFNL